MIFECSVCGYVYDEEDEGRPWADLPDDWVCPICGADTSYFDALDAPADKSPDPSGNVGDLENYLGAWKRPSDDLEESFSVIQKMAIGGE